MCQSMVDITSNLRPLRLGEEKEEEEEEEEEDRNYRMKI